MDLRKVCDSVDEQGWVKVAIKIANNKVAEAKTVLDQLGYTAYDIEGSGNDRVIKVSTQHPDETKAKLLPKFKEAGITPISTRVTDSNKRLDEYILGSLRANGIESAVNVEQHKDGFRVSLQGNTDVYLDIYLDGENVVVRGFDPDSIVNATRYATFAGVPVEQAKRVIRKFEKWANKVQKLDARPVTELESVRVADSGDLVAPKYALGYIAEDIKRAIGIDVRVVPYGSTFRVLTSDPKDKDIDLILAEIWEDNGALKFRLKSGILALGMDEYKEGALIKEAIRKYTDNPDFPYRVRDDAPVTEQAVRIAAQGILGKNAARVHATSLSKGTFIEAYSKDDPKAGTVLISSYAGKRTVQFIRGEDGSKETKDKLKELADEFRSSRKVKDSAPNVGTKVSPADVLHEIKAYGNSNKAHYTVEALSGTGERPGRIVVHNEGAPVPRIEVSVNYPRYDDVQIASIGEFGDDPLYDLLDFLRQFYGDKPADIPAWLGRIDRDTITDSISNADIIDPVREAIGDAEIIEHLVRYMSDYELEEFVDDLKRNYDLDFLEDSVEDLKLPKFSSNAKLNKLCTLLAESILAKYTDESTETMLSELQRYKSEFPHELGYNFAQQGNTDIISYSDAQDALRAAGYTTKMSDEAAWDAICRTMGQVIRTLLEHKEELLKQKVTDSYADAHKGNMGITPHDVIDVIRTLPRDKFLVELTTSKTYPAEVLVSERGKEGVTDPTLVITIDEGSHEIKASIVGGVDEDGALPEALNLIRDKFVGKIGEMDAWVAAKPRVYDAADKSYVVGLWPFSGYGLLQYNVAAGSEEEALDKAVVAAIKAGDKTIIPDSESTEDMRNSEDFLYVDATMDGAPYPVYVDATNLKIVETTGRTVTDSAKFRGKSGKLRAQKVADASGVNAYAASEAMEWAHRNMALLRNLTVASHKKAMTDLANRLWDLGVNADIAPDKLSVTVNGKKFAQSDIESLTIVGSAPISMRDSDTAIEQGVYDAIQKYFA